MRPFRGRIVLFGVQIGRVSLFGTRRLLFILVLAMAGSFNEVFPSIPVASTFCYSLANGLIILEQHQMRYLMTP